MKNKNNILIILTVTLAALAVIAIVLITGFASGRDSDESTPFVSGDMTVDTSEESEPAISEPTNVPEESSDPESTDSDFDNSSDNSSAAVVDNVGQRIATSASALIGVPFVENGASPSGFDNSGFIYYVLQGNGYITCPRTTLAQSQMGARVGRDALKTGDLMFFSSNGSGEADFGGIYIGEGKMIACLSAGSAVREVDTTNDYYMANFSFGVCLS